MEDLLELSLLGEAVIRRGGAPIAGLNSRKAEALLIYLACNSRQQSQGIARSRLADLLWDERTEDLTMSNLRTLLTRLRPHLTPHLIINRDSVLFDRSHPYHLDVEELEQTVAASRQEYISKGAYSGDTVARLEKAIASYRGDFLQGFHLRDASGFEDWADQERERLHTLVVKTLQNLVTYRLGRGEFQAGIEQAAHLLKLEPLREEAHRQMLQLLALNGQRSAALQHYKTYERYLARELDMAPEASTTDLYERIKSGELQLQKELSLNQDNRKRNALSEARDREELLAARVAQLKRVSLFSYTPDKLLRELALLLEEVQVKAGETIFQKGEPGQCMYIIVSGQVRVFNEQRVLNDLGERDIFGEMALLDTAPRLASVAALEDTRLWRLEQEALYKLMAERIEVSRGIIQVLSRRLRDRVEDISFLEEQLRALTTPAATPQ